MGAKIENYQIGHVPPQSLDLEAAVLGAILIDREALGIVSRELLASDFYTDAHQKIYQACAELSREFSPIDILTVTQRLRDNGNLQQVGGGFYLVQLTNGIASAANIEYHARVIKEASMKRQVIELCQKSAHEAYQPGTDVFDLFESVLKQMVSLSAPLQDGSKTVTLGDAALLLLKQIHESQQGKSKIIYTGLSDVDIGLGGLMGGELYVIAARPGMGKTELALKIAKHASDTGNHVHFVTLEMTPPQLAGRIISEITGIAGGAIRSKKLTADQIRQIAEATDLLQSAKMTITTQRTPDSLYAYAMRMKAEGKLDMLIVDYLQLMEDKTAGNKFSNREQEISRISQTLKRISVDFNIPVLELSQLSRQVEGRPGRKPQLSDLRESGAVEQDADVVIFLMRPAVYGFDEYEVDKQMLPSENLMLFEVAKFRGDSPFEVPLKFDGGHIYDWGASTKTHEQGQKSNTGQKTGQQGDFETAYNPAIPNPSRIEEDSPF